MSKLYRGPSSIYRSCNITPGCLKHSVLPQKIDSSSNRNGSRCVRRLIKTAGESLCKYRIIIHSLLAPIHPVQKSFSHESGRLNVVRPAAIDDQRNDTLMELHTAHLSPSIRAIYCIREAKGSGQKRSLHRFSTVWKHNTETDRGYSQDGLGACLRKIRVPAYVQIDISERHQR